jgi:phosphate transport system protein
MTRTIFDERIKDHQDTARLIAEMVAQAMLNAVKALEAQDIVTAKKVYAGDQAINEKCLKLEEAIILTISTQQPVAKDIRLLTSLLEINTELERMGDYAKGIARIAVKTAQEAHMLKFFDIPRMATLVTRMLKNAIESFVNEDAELAELVYQSDDQVDALYQQTERVLFTYMLSDPTKIDSANMLLWAAHNLERMGDRVTNICERTIYVVTGEMQELWGANDELLDLVNPKEE